MNDKIKHNIKSGQEMQQKGLRDILIEMRDKTEKSIKKIRFIDNKQKMLELFYTYRTLTKIIEGKSLSIFDFYIIGNLKGVTNER